jgi:hypothetical protein
MGSHFLTLYVAPLGKLSIIIGSKDLANLAALGIAEGSAERPYIEKLIQRDYVRDPETFEAEDGAPLIRALAALCKKTATTSVTLELYEDEEETPELWNFIWSDWEPEDPFELPLSPNGSPAVTFKDSKAAAVWLSRFEKVKKAGGYDSRYLSSDDLARLILVLQEALKQSSDVFAFIEY